MILEQENPVSGFETEWRGEEEEEESENGEEKEETKLTAAATDDLFAPREFGLTKISQLLT